MLVRPFKKPYKELAEKNPQVILRVSREVNVCQTNCNLQLLDFKYVFGKTMNNTSLIKTVDFSNMKNKIFCVLPRQSA